MPPYPLVLLAFGLTLFYWVEFYHISVKAIRQNEMLKKVNKNYQTDVTLKTIMGQLGTLKKFQIPFAVMVLLGFGVQGLQAGLFSTQRHHTLAAIIASTVYFMVCWVILTVAFLVYGRRLVAIMPDELAHKVKQFTRTVTIVSLLNLVFFMASGILVLTFFCAVPITISSLIALIVVFHQLPIIVMWLLMTVFMKKRWNPLRWFDSPSKSPTQEQESRQSANSNADKVESEL